jgi:hypothetical protein
MSITAAWNSNESLLLLLRPIGHAWPQMVAFRLWPIRLRLSERLQSAPLG